MFKWNIAFAFLIEIKREYVRKFGNADVYDLKAMIHALDEPCYNHFLGCVKVTQDNALYPSFVLVKYYLLGKEKPDLYENPTSMYREMQSLVVDFTWKPPLQPPNPLW